MSFFCPSIPSSFLICPIYAGHVFFPRLTKPPLRPLEMLPPGWLDQELEEEGEDSDDSRSSGTGGGSESDDEWEGGRDNSNNKNGDKTDRERSGSNVSDLQY